MRLFLGIPLPALVVEELMRVSLRYRAAGDGLRWSAPESWHITLQFLGSVEAERLACIRQALHVLRHAPVSIAPGPLDIFDRAGVFFAGIDLTPGLESLQRHITAATLPCGFPPETRPYHPHVTLARSKAGAGALSLRALKERIRRSPVFTRFEASEYVLYESLPGPGSARYEVRDRFQFILR